MMKKRTEITIEMERVTLIGNSKSPVIWCEACAAPVKMLTVDGAAALAGETSRSIYRRVESGQIHFAETPDGRLFICPDSLS
jgi:hypothetical protein